MISPLRMLPDKYRVLDHVVPFQIPGFMRQCTPGNLLFAPAEIDSKDWFNRFADTVIAAIGKRYLPVCRLSDGEFKLLLGEHPFLLLQSMPHRIHQWVRMCGRRILRRRVNFATWQGVSSGSYDREEILKFRQKYGEQLVRLSEQGFLAIHLSYGPVPFQEQYFPSFKQWLIDAHLALTFQNYAPFYFVYALLTGPRRSAVLKGRRVLLVNGADRAKQVRIEASLLREGVTEVYWCPISASRSMFDQIDIAPWRGRVDLALVGAGVGKPNILLQLEPLGVPAIDAGFVFEVWSEPEMRWHRPVCVPDDSYDKAQVKFLPPGFSA